MSGRAGGSPAPANEDTDWITGMESIDVLDEMLTGRIELWLAAGLLKEVFGVLQKILFFRDININVKLFKHEFLKHYII